MIQIQTATQTRIATQTQTAIQTRIATRIQIATQTRQSDSDSRVTPPNNEQKAPSNPKGEVNHSNKVSKQHKTDALPRNRKIRAKTDVLYLVQ